MIAERPIAELAGCIEYFPGPQLAMVAASIVAGHTAGRLWQAEDCALLWDQGNNVFYLACSHPAAKVTTALADVLFGPIYAAALASGRTRFKVRALSPALDQALPQIFGDLELRDLPELFLSYNHTSPPEVARPALAGLAFALIDGPLLARTELEHIAAVHEEIHWMWPSSDRFAQYGFGSAALIDQQLICWCTAEYLSSGMCGIGITTAEGYQRQGVATATAAQFVDECLRRSIRPFWECAAYNTASLRVAQRLGFTLVEQPLFRYGGFPTIAFRHA